MKQQKGFTLVEAAVAIGVVAILSGIIIPLVMKNLKDARNARARNDINVIVAAIAAQMKDTGSRPRAAGPNASTGAGDAMWFSSARVPERTAGAALDAGNQLFTNLFAQDDNTQDSNVLFSLLAPGAGANLPANAEHRYKGPYLATDVATKNDPWGRAYLVLGYNLNGQTSDGPVWVVSAGESQSILAANLAVGGNGRYPAAWDGIGVSAANIAVRAN